MMEADKQAAKLEHMKEIQIEADRELFGKQRRDRYSNQLKSQMKLKHVAQFLQQTSEKAEDGITTLIDQMNSDVYDKIEQRRRRDRQVELKQSFDRAIVN